MHYYSTNKKSPKVNFETAVREGLAPDGGLYFPESIPILPSGFFEKISTLDKVDIGFQVAKAFIGEEIPTQHLRRIVAETLSFDIPLIKVEHDVYSLELFQGPTLAFKDVGARFMARVLQYFLNKKSDQATILVATSGDTGSAVASGFFDVPGINVVILYPSGKISSTQEKQLTTWGKNIYAFEVDGTFDDCQRLAKEAFGDKVLTSKYNLTSANSINIARLLPQSFYYFLAYQQLKERSKPLVISVPSGNLGNLTAGLIAWKLGLPIDRFVIAANVNDVVPKYLATGIFSPRPSVLTVANAMDVGNPSNFARVSEVFGGDYNILKKMLSGYSFTDLEIKKCIAATNKTYNYTLDPHGACGYMGLKEAIREDKATGIFLETAHPAKFSNVVEDSIGAPIEIPDSLKKVIEKEKKAILCEATLDSLKNKLAESF